MYELACTTKFFNVVQNISVRVSITRTQLRRILKGVHLDIFEHFVVDINIQMVYLRLLKLATLLP